MTHSDDNVTPSTPTIAMKTEAVRLLKKHDDGFRRAYGRALGGNCMVKAGDALAAIVEAIHAAWNRRPAPSDDSVARVAEAIHIDTVTKEAACDFIDAHHGFDEELFTQAGGGGITRSWIDHKAVVRIVQAALSAAPDFFAENARKGWRLVPIEPTPEIVAAMCAAGPHDERGRDEVAPDEALAMWAAGVTAAPTETEV